MSCLTEDTFDYKISSIITDTFQDIGVSPFFTGSILWDEEYPELDIDYERGQNLVCTFQIGAPIIRLTALLACNTIEHFLATNQKLGRGVTLNG